MKVVDEGLFACVVALIFEGLGMLGILDVLVFAVVACVGGDELVGGVVEEDLLGKCSETDGAALVWRQAVLVGLIGDAVVFALPRVVVDSDVIGFLA